MDVKGFESIIRVCTSSAMYEITMMMMLYAF